MKLVYFASRPFISLDCKVRASSTIYSPTRLLVDLAVFVMTECCVVACWSSTAGETGETGVSECDPRDRTEATERVCCEVIQDTRIAIIYNTGKGRGEWETPLC